MATTTAQLERIAHRHLGMAKPEVGDKRPAQHAPRLPILVHTCFVPLIVDDIVTNTKPTHCSCKLRVSNDEGIRWIETKRGFWVPVFRKNGKQILNHKSLVLTAEYAAIRERKFDANPILQPCSITEFDEYNPNFVERVETDLTHTKRDREIQAVRHMEIKQRRKENEIRNHHRGGAEGFIRGNGGLTVGGYGNKHLRAGNVGKGNGPDAWDRENEERKSKPDPYPTGARPIIPGILNYGIEGIAGKALNADDPRLASNRRTDHRVLPHDPADAVSRKEERAFLKEHDATIMS
jgi:hypothetical protein